MICEGCNKPLSPLDAMLANLPVCISCVKARHRATTTGGRCKCGNVKRESAEMGGKRRGARRWIACLRCLGVIRQTG